MLTSSLLTWTPDWLRRRPRCCCCCCCCGHAAVGTTYERRKQRQTHQTVNDVLDVRITSIRFFRTDLIGALDNGLCVLAPTPGNHTHRCCTAVDVLKSCHWHFLKVYHCICWCELRQQLLRFLSFFSGRLLCTWLVPHFKFRNVHLCYNYGATLSTFATSVPTILMVSRCQVSRFPSPHK